MENLSLAAQEVKIIEKLSSLTSSERQELKEKLNTKSFEYCLLLKRFWYEFTNLQTSKN